jgi:hypothetical protein
MALGSTQPLTETSTRNLSGNKGRPSRKADNLIAMSRKCGSLDVSQPYGPQRPVTGTALPLYSEYKVKHIIKSDVKPLHYYRQVLLKFKI